jgi:hypothetical protein
VFQEIINQVAMKVHEVENKYIFFWKFTC